MIALPGLIPRSSPMAWFVTLLAVFGAPVGIELIVALHRAGWLHPLNSAIIFPSLILAAILVAAGVKQGIYPWSSEGICSGKFWTLQIFILLGGLSVAALVAVALSHYICWGDTYRINSAFFFPKLDAGQYPGTCLFVNCLIGITVAYPIIGIAQAALYRRSKRTDWLRSFLSFEVQSLAVLCIAFISLSLIPLLVGVLTLCGHPIYFQEKHAFLDGFRTSVALSTVPFSLAGMMTALASSQNVRIAQSCNFAPLLVTVNIVAALLISIYLCIQSVFPTVFLVVDAYFNHNLGRERKAINSISEAIRIRSNDPGLYFQRAALNNFIGASDASARDYGKCLELGGYYSAAFSNLIAYKSSKGDLAAALRVADLYVDKHPNSADAYIWRADMHGVAGEKELARGDYLEALKRLSSMNYDLEDVYYVNVALGNLKEAERTVRQLIQNQPEYFWRYFELSLVLNKQHRYREAVQAASGSIKLEPLYCGSYCVRGEALYDLGEYRRALDDFGKAIDLNPRLGKPFYCRSKVYEKLGDKDRAASDLAESKRLGYSTQDDMWL